MEVEAKKIKEFILDANLVTKEQLEKAEKEAKKKDKNIEDILVEEGLVSQEKISKLQAYVLGIPFVDLENEAINLEILKIIPEAVARSSNIIAFRKNGNNLEVAMLDPEDLRAIEFIEKKSDMKILPRLTTPKSIKAALSQYQKTLEAEFGDIINKDKAGLKYEKGEELSEEKSLLKEAEELPIIKVVDTLMKHAILGRASDIHIEPTEKDVIVRYRIDGILHDAMTLPKSVSSGIVARIKVLSNLKLDEHRLPQDGRFKIESDDYKYSTRVSVLPIFDGEKIVMRLLPETNNAFSLESLGLQGQDLENINEALKKPVGMILVTGPTGSGKTTTLYAMMEILNTSDVNISTIEDPIEYRMPRINQTQVNAKIDLTFANGLRSLVRQDPDIIMVGEIRDNETVGLAINAALTGHLVLSTLHTISAAGAIPRLIDMKAEPFLISSTINVILAQRLVRKLTTEKEKYSLTEAEVKNLSKYCDLEKVLGYLKKAKLAKAGDSLKDVTFYHPRPTKENLEGYHGRVGIFETLLVTDKIKELIVKKATSDEIRDQAISEGMKTMVEDGFFKAAQGLTSIEEILRAIIE